MCSRQHARLQRPIDGCLNGTYSCVHQGLGPLVASCDGTICVAQLLSDVIRWVEEIELIQCRQFGPNREQSMLDNFQL